MTNHFDPLPSMELLLWSLNAALASLVVCGAGLALSRGGPWSLPWKHAVLVLALVISISAPFVLAICETPSLAVFAVSAEPVAASGAVGEPLARAATRQAAAEAVIAAVSPLEVMATSEVATDFKSPSAAELAAETSRPTSTVRHVARSWWRIAGAATLVVWMIGIAVGMVRMAHCLAAASRWRRTLGRYEDVSVRHALRLAADGVGLRRHVVLVASQAVPAPAIFGLLRPTIAVPAGIEVMLPFDQLCAVLRHELAHVRRRDAWTGLVQGLAGMIYWWNPLVHLANRRLADLREQICDDIASHGLAQRRDYAATLIEMADRSTRGFAMPATLGIGVSPASQLEARVRRILARPASEGRLTRRAKLGAVAVALLMTAAVASAQVKIKPGTSDRDAKQTPRSSAASKGAPRPLDELLRKMAQHERAYFPFHIKEASTFRPGDDLTAEQRARIPWSDGRKHGRLLEYAQMADRVWFYKETQTLDGKASEIHTEMYSDGERQVQFNLGHQAPLKPAEVYIEPDPRRIARWQWVPPIMGIFPLTAFSDGDLLTRAFQNKSDEIRLDWDGDDARLTFEYGPGNIRTRFVLWLSREHAWHPVKLRRYMPTDSEQFQFEWVVTRFAIEDGKWRVSEGTIHNHDDNGKPSARPVYSTDFQILEAEWGKPLSEEIFKYEIPAGAEIHDPRRPKVDEPLTATRELTVRVVDVHEKPVIGASVLFRGVRDLREFDRVKTSDDGMARSDKLPDDNVVVIVEAEGYRPADWVIGRGMSEHRVLLTPPTSGLALDERGSVLPMVQITSDLTFRADGLPLLPTGRSGTLYPDRSNAQGRFELNEQLTLRNLETPALMIAIDKSLEMMSIRFVSPRDLARQQTFTLRPVCQIEGDCLLEGITEPMELRATIIADNGQRIASVPATTSVTASGLLAKFRFRLPQGQYSLQARQTSNSPAFSLPVTVSGGQRQLDLGTTTVAASGTLALKGKPAPELDVRWRDGQTWSLDKLRGRVVVLDFWGTWCGPCVAQMPQLMDIAQQFQGDQVDWLAIHTPSDEAFDEFDRELAEIQHRSWQDRELPFMTVFDSRMSDDELIGKTAHRYGVVQWPTLIVIDQSGTVVGAVAKENLAETLHRLLDGREGAK